MADNNALAATMRAELGKATTRRLRRLSGRVPAVLYGGEAGPVHISLAANEVSKAFENPAFQSQILTLDIDSQASQQVVVKDKQLHPAKGHVMHMDFLRVIASQPIHMTVPLAFSGEEAAPGVKQGGIVSHHVTEVDIVCLPADLPKSIAVDVSALDLDQAIHMTELVLPKGVAFVVEIDEAHDQSVVSIHLPRVIEEAEEETAEAAAGEAADTKEADSSD